MFVTKKKYEKLEELNEVLSKELKTEAARTAVLEKEIEKLQADLKKKNSLPAIGADVETAAEKIGYFQGEEEYKKYYCFGGGYRIQFSGNIKVDLDELNKAAIAAVKAAIETLESENRRYAVLEYIFANLIGEAVKFAEADL